MLCTNKKVLFFRKVFFYSSNLRNFLHMNRISSVIKGNYYENSIYINGLHRNRSFFPIVYYSTSLDE